MTDDQIKEHLVRAHLAESVTLDADTWTEVLEEVLRLREVSYDLLGQLTALRAAQSMRERMAQSENRQYDADHVVLEKGTNDCVCMHCGQRYHIHMPVPMSIMTAIVDAFIEAHHKCEKTEAA